MMPDGDEYGPEIRLEFTDVDGRIQQWKVLAARKDSAPPRSPLLYTKLEVEVPEGRDGQARLTQKAIPQASAAGEQPHYARLEQEVRIGLALHRRWGDTGYPRELAHIVGYDMDGEEPFVLYECFRGDPAAHVAGRLVLEEQRTFQAGLLRGIRILEQAGIVHRGITPHSVRWDGEGVQLADFDLATARGRRRAPAGGRPWAPPQQRQGIGYTHPGDDVWGAGMVIYHVTTGRAVNEVDRAPDLRAAQPRTRGLLEGVFAEKAVNRPGAADLLTRLRVPDPVPPPDEAYDFEFEIGRYRFDEMMRQKWGTAYTPPREPADQSAEDPPEPEPETEQGHTQFAPAPLPDNPPPLVRSGQPGMAVVVIAALALLGIALFVMGVLL